MPFKVHILTVLVFIIAGGILASLNHTRYDLGIRWAFIKVHYHDDHHVVFNTNYSQYTMFWDCVWGTFNDPAHPKKSLAKNGQSLQAEKRK